MMTDKECEIAYHLWVLANQLDAVAPFISRQSRATGVMRQLAASMARQEMAYAKRLLEGSDYEILTEDRRG